MSCSPSRPGISAYTRDPDISVRRASRRDGQSIPSRFCGIAVSDFTMRVCGYAAIPHEPAEPPTRWINAPAARSQPANNQMHILRMSDVPAVY